MTSIINQSSINENKIEKYQISILLVLDLSLVLAFKIAKSLCLALWYDLM